MQPSAAVKHMTTVGIRALKQNASEVVRQAAAGDVITITDHRSPITASRSHASCHSVSYG